jgi:hypothetical protein
LTNQGLGKCCIRDSVSRDVERRQDGLAHKANRHNKTLNSAELFPGQTLSGCDEPDTYPPAHNKQPKLPKRAATQDGFSFGREYKEQSYACISCAI